MDKTAMNLRASYWRGLILECNNRPANMTKKEWYAARGINSRSALYWQRKFRNEAILQVTESSPNGSESCDRDDNGNCFVDITTQLVKSESQIPTQSLQSQKASVGTVAATAQVPIAPEIMLEYGDFKVFLGNRFTKSQLKNVLEVLCDVSER